MKRNVRSILVGFIIIGVSLGETLAQGSKDYILEMSLEDLLNMEITSVSKKSERLQDVASSIYVVNSEEIMQSGATTLHEVLRNVPGYWGVQDQYSSVYATIRNSPPANAEAATVLYLLDGTPLQDVMGSTFSFQNFDFPLDEIDRIEIIRGSGGTVYGANSATGVVNIFTKSPEKYDGVNARIEVANPRYIAPSVRLGGKVTDKLAISGYAKYRHFKGFESMAGVDESGEETVKKSRFIKNYDQSDYYSAGAKLHYSLTENTKVSGRIHFNARSQTMYSNSFSSDFVFTQQDLLYENNVNANRVVANVRLDQKFNDKHSLFARASTNVENDFYRPAGGMKISNSVYDFEIQDNFAIGAYNNIGIGVNYRMVNFDVYNINDTNQLNYVAPQSNETLTGAFIQDKIQLLAGKLNFTVGVKAENYSLVNSTYYFSPMAKFAFIANSNLTVWGGFTQSYTTPGFNNTNVDLFLYQAPTRKDMEDEAVSRFVGAEATPEEAEAFLASESGQVVVDFIESKVVEGGADNSYAVRNGTKTVPTKFQTIELGVKTSFSGKIQFNATGFLTRISDGVGASFEPVLFDQSQTQPGRMAFYYLSGNYLKGESMGTESMIRTFPISNLIIEFSHTWLQTEWDWQENDDFDVTNLSQSTANSTVPFVPEHVFRLRANYTLPSGLNINAQVMQSSKFRKSARYSLENERYDNIVEFEITGTRGTLVAPNDTRTIVNLRVEQPLWDKKMKIYAFGNDITNPGRIEDTDNVRNVTLSQIGSMYGLGLNYTFQ